LLLILLAPCCTGIFLHVGGFAPATLPFLDRALASSPDKPTFFFLCFSSGQPPDGSPNKHPERFFPRVRASLVRKRHDPRSRHAFSELTPLGLPLDSATLAFWAPSCFFSCFWIHAEPPPIPKGKLHLAPSPPSPNRFLVVFWLFESSPGGDGLFLMGSFFQSLWGFFPLFRQWRSHWLGFLGVAFPFSLLRKSKSLCLSFLLTSDSPPSALS